MPSPNPVSDRKPDYTHQVRYDGDAYEEDLPPELFDQQEDQDELAIFKSIAAHIDE